MLGSELGRTQSDPHVYRNPNGEGLPHWPMFDQEDQYMQLNTQPAVGRALKAHRLQFWTKTLPQKTQEGVGVGGFCGGGGLPDVPTHAQRGAVSFFLHSHSHSFIHSSTHLSIQQTLKNQLPDVPKPAMGPLFSDTVNKPSQEAS